MCITMGDADQNETKEVAEENNSILSVSRPTLFHPSIFYTHLFRRSGRGGAGTYPSGHRARGGVHPGQVASPSQGHTETNNHTHSHSLLRTILDSPINLTCMFLDGGSKPEYPERTHAYTGRICKLHTERPQLGIESETLSLWGDGANHPNLLFW